MSQQTENAFVSTSTTKTVWPDKSTCKGFPKKMDASYPKVHGSRELRTKH